MVYSYLVPYSSSFMIKIMLAYKVDWRGFWSFLIIWNSLSNRNLHRLKIWLELNISSSWAHTRPHFSASLVVRVACDWVLANGMGQKQTPSSPGPEKPPIFHPPCTIFFCNDLRSYLLKMVETGWKKHGFLNYHWETANNQWGTPVLVSMWVKDKLLLC